MSEETPDEVTEESSPQPDVEEETSPQEEETQIEEATSQQATETKEPPFHEHPRWKEVMSDRDKSAQEAAYWKGKAEQPAQVPQQPIDPYAGMDAETERFWRNSEKRTQGQIDQALAIKEKDYQATIEALASQNAKIQEKIFRQEQDDVVPGSPEEQEIANLIRAGLDPERAAMAVMGDKRIAAAKVVKQTTNQQKVQQKAQANVETSGVAPNSGLPKDHKMSTTELLEENAKNMGITLRD